MLGARPLPYSEDKVPPDVDKHTSMLLRLSQRRHLSWLATLPSWDQLFGDAWRDLFTMGIIGVVVSATARALHTTANADQGLVFHFDNVVLGGNDISFMLWNEHNEFVAYVRARPRLVHCSLTWLFRKLANLD